MAEQSKRDRGKERFWRRTLRQWQRSGLSVRAFCAEHGLAEPSFYSWRRIIAQRDRQLAPVPVDDAPVFVPLRVIDASSGQVALEVVLDRGRVVRVLRGFDADMLRQLLAVLEEDRPC
jgi:transposase-like protein